MKVNSMCKCLLAAVAALLVPAAMAWAQGGSAAAAAPTKIATISVRNAIIGTAEGKEASAELQSQFAPKQTEMQNMQKQYDEIQTRLSTGDRTLSDEEKARLQRQAELLTHKIQRSQDDLQEELQAAQDDVLNRIGRKMLDVIDRYARENGFAVVLDTSQSNLVIYGANQVDITAQIVQLYDQAYPVKPASATPRPAPQTPPKNPPGQ
ncbi:MAG TPA: OmpH family outer membrane protein [Methylomirabilota bacterium]|nr:OmpH family outer membrane protein [Methylomirabilota bacterium]